jgi:hypothetical protein
MPNKHVVHVAGSSEGVSLHIDVNVHANATVLSLAICGTMS